MISLLILGAALGVVPDATQAKWKEIGKTSAGNSVYVDPRTVKKAADGIVTATLRTAFTKPVATPKGTITSSRTVAMFDCGKKTVAVKENIFFHDEKTNKVFDRSAAGKPGYGPAIKGTLPDIAMTYLCK